VLIAKARVLARWRSSRRATSHVIRAWRFTG
jgi:hypothetical protein